MSAALRNLIGLRSLLAEEVLGYLDAVAADAAALPAYYPSHLREGAAGETPFDRIRQVVQVIDEDQREALQRWRAEDRERQRAAGIEDRMAYDPVRARPELAEHEEEREGAERREAVHREPPPPIEWDAYTGARFPRAVLLGDPGGGKTWLLRYEARCIARESATQLRAGEATVETLPLPFLFRLSDLAASGAEIEQAIPQRALAALKPTLARLGRAAPSAGFLRLVAQSLVRGTAVVLLDAWDEVPAGSLSRPDADNPREALGPRLARFGQAHPRLRLLVSSRIVGYPGKPAPDWHELELLAFDAPQIERFTHVWFGPRAPAFTNLLDLLRRQVQLAGLARIPLMLALICRVFDESGEKGLPTRRVELYERCLLGLLLHWGKERSGRAVVSRRQPGEEGYAEALLEVLQASAFELFETQHEQFTEARLTRSLNRSLGELKQHHPLRGRSAPELIAELATRGVLTESGSGHYLFLHRTVHEYLVARHVAACVEAAGGSGSQRWNRARVRLPDGTEVSVHPWADERAIRPAYAQPLQLLSGRLTEPLPLLQLLADEERDDILRHKLALAGACTGEIDPAIRARYARMNPDPLSVIASAAFDYWAECDEKHVGILAQHFLPALRAIAVTRIRLSRSRPEAVLSPQDQDLTELLVQLLARGDLRLTWTAVELLSRLRTVLCAGPLYAALAPLLSIDRSWALREAAAEAMGYVIWVEAPPDLMDLLENMMESEDPGVAVTGARVVGRIGPTAATDRILAALAHLLTVPDFEVRRAAASAVSVLGGAAARESLLEPLVRGLTGATGAGAIEATAEIVGLLGPALTLSPQFSELRDALVGVIKNGTVREKTAALRSMGRLGPISVNEAAVDALAGLMEDTSPDLRAESAEVVGILGPRVETNTIIERLAHLLTDPHRYVRLVAAQAVRRFRSDAAKGSFTHTIAELLTRGGAGSQEAALEALSSWNEVTVDAELQDLVTDQLNHPNPRVRLAAVEALERLARSDDQTVVALSRLLEDSDAPVRRAAARTVGRLASLNLQCVTNELERFLCDSRPHVRLMAATVCGLNPELAKPMAHLLKNLLYDPDTEVKKAAIDAAGGLGLKAREVGVIDGLVPILECEDRGIRWAAARALARLGPDGATFAVVDALGRLLDHSDDDLRWIASDVIGAMGAAAATDRVLGVLVRFLDGGTAVRAAASNALAKLSSDGVRIFRNGRGGLKAHVV